MTSNTIRYQKVSWKYRLAEDVCSKTRIKPWAPIVLPFVELDLAGNLIGRKGYCWDGCSGPTWDTNTNMRAGANHDIKFQLMRLGLIDRNEYYHVANEEFFEDLRVDGMVWVRAMYYYKMVDKFSWFATLPKEEPPILTAP